MSSYHFTSETVSCPHLGRFLTFLSKHVIFFVDLVRGSGLGVCVCVRMCQTSMRTHSLRSAVPSLKRAHYVPNMFVSEVGIWVSVCWEQGLATGEHGVERCFREPRRARYIHCNDCEQICSERFALKRVRLAFSSLQRSAVGGAKQRNATFC